MPKPLVRVVEAGADDAWRFSTTPYQSSTYLLSPAKHTTQQPSFLTETSVADPVDLYVYSILSSAQHDVSTLSPRLAHSKFWDFVEFSLNALVLTL